MVTLCVKCLIYLLNSVLDYCSFYIIVLNKLVFTNQSQVAQQILKGNFKITYFKFCILVYLKLNIYNRYLICKWRLDNIQDIKKYLFNVNLIWNKLGPKEDILSIVPLQEILQDSCIFKYLWDSNNK